MYDIEQFVADLLAIAKAKLNDKLLAIDAEKADGITMQPIPPEAIFFQTLDEAAAPYNAFLYYGLDNPVSVANGPYIAQQVTVYFIVVLRRTPDTVATMQRILRYQRALAEIFQEGWANSPSGCKLSVSGLSPSDFGLLKTGAASHRTVGVQIQSTIG